jgi:hypothetical protein
MLILFARLKLFALCLRKHSQIKQNNTNYYEIQSTTKQQHNF